MLHLDRRMADHREQRLVAPNVGLERRHIEVADQDCALVPEQPASGRVGHAPQEVQLVIELLVDRGVGFVPSGRDVEIVNCQPRGRPCRVGERDRQMPRVIMAAERAALAAGQRDARDRRDTVVALLAVDRDVLVAECPQIAGRKLAVRALRLLKAEDVGLVLAEETADQGKAKANGINVPGRERQIQEAGSRVGVGQVPRCSRANASVRQVGARPQVA